MDDWPEELLRFNPLSKREIAALSREEKMAEVVRMQRHLRIETEKLGRLYRLREMLDEDEDGEDSG